MVYVRSMVHIMRVLMYLQSTTYYTNILLISPSSTIDVYSLYHSYPVILVVDQLTYSEGTTPQQPLHQDLLITSKPMELAPAWATPSRWVSL